MSDAGRSLTRRECLFAGRVQGVGFRYTTRQIAARFDVAGFVQNLPDGRVLLVVEGTHESIDSLIAAVRAELDRFIHSVQAQDRPATHEFSSFEIRH